MPSVVWRSKFAHNLQGIRNGGQNAVNQPVLKANIYNTVTSIFLMLLKNIYPEEYKVVIGLDQVLNFILHHNRFKRNDLFCTQHENFKQLLHTSTFHSMMLITIQQFQLHMP